jgi:hypothetical protein
VESLVVKPGDVLHDGELELEQWAELRREHFVRGVSIKELMRRTGLARNTIRSGGCQFFCVNGFVGCGCLAIAWC